MNALKVVKLLVVVMSLLLVGGLALLAWGMMRQSEDMAAKETPAVAARPMAPVAGAEVLSSPSGPLRLPLGQPEGSRVVSMTAQGALLYLSIEGGLGDQGALAPRVVVVDLSKGAVAAILPLGR